MAVVRWLRLFDFVYLRCAPVRKASALLSVAQRLRKLECPQLYWRSRSLGVARALIDGQECPSYPRRLRFHTAYLT